MEKIPTIFDRDWSGDRSRVVDAPHPECAWVFAGEGVATRKYDGTCCMYDGTWWKRREIKKGKPHPQDFVLAMEDETTGKRVGWVPVGDGDKWHLEGIENAGPAPEYGTYELVGPKVQGNPENYPRHEMVAHADAEAIACPRDFRGLAKFLSDFPHEGVVFHHPDGRMAKIKRRDFGHK